MRVCDHIRWASLPSACIPAPRVLEDLDDFGP